MDTNSEALTLYQLTNNIQIALQEKFMQTVWVVAEISELRINRSGHAYLELVERDVNKNKTIAKIKAIIWASIFRMLKAYFESSTSYEFESGIKVMLNVSVDYHEVYGISLNVRDIDPKYTIGDIELQKQKILEQLTNEGVIDMNKELDFPYLAKNIAVISSPTAAGYEDFLTHLNNNSYNYKFNIKLYEAIMQGNKTEESVINALDKIYNNIETFDIVIIIRGGGSKSDLSYFDSYWMAANICQFPIPILTGIGHERDLSIADQVAWQEFKTPTAVADFLVDHFVEHEQFLNSLELQLNDQIKDNLNKNKELINNFSNQLYIFTKELLHDKERDIVNLKNTISNKTMQLLLNEKQKLNYCSEKLYIKSNKVVTKSDNSLVNLKLLLKNSVLNYITNKKHELDLIENIVEMQDPKHVMKKGYSIIRQNNKLIKSISDINKDEVIENIFVDGKTISKIIKLNSDSEN